MTSPTWSLGPGAVAAGRDIRGPVSVTIVNGTFDRLRDAIFDPRPLAGVLDLAHFTGREWLIARIDEFVATRRKGYVVVQGEAGVGKTALAAHLVWTRPCVHHFTRLEGARAPEQARKSLAAQLIGAWRLAEEFTPGDAFPVGADRPDWLLKVLRAAAERRDQLEPERPLLLVVDGLDEADEPAPGQDTGIPLGLPRAEHLPDRVFIVATSRFGRPMPALRDPVLWSTIAVDGRDNLEDMRRYLSGIAMGPAPDRELVERLLNSAVSAESFCDTLAQRCAGVWIYLRYVLEAILDGQRSPADLDSLPAGLVAYYLEQIQGWRRQDGWATVGLPALATLAALRRPAALAELGRFALSTEEPLREWLDERLRPFLAVTHDAQRRRQYAVRHESLRDLFYPTDTEEVERDAGLRDALRASVVEAHARITATLIPSTSGGHDWTSIDDYTRAALPEHAAACGRLDELVMDPGFLLAANQSALLRTGTAVTTDEGRASLGAYKLCVGRWCDEDDSARAWLLHVWARKTRAHSLAAAAAQLSGSPWTIARAWWRGTGHQILTGHQGMVWSVAVGRAAGREVIVSGGGDRAVLLWLPRERSSAGRRHSRF